MLSLTQSEPRRHRVLIEVDLSGNGRSVLGDQVQLRQVLLNLIMNGVEAMTAITDRARRLVITAGLTALGDALVAIDDNGTGLDPAIADRVFAPFFRTKADGMGMGLSICRSIIETHGGRLWASPCQPYGSSFRFTVPTMPTLPRGAEAACIDGSLR